MRFTQKTEDTFQQIQGKIEAEINKVRNDCCQSMTKVVKAVLDDYIKFELPKKLDVEFNNIYSKNDAYEQRIIYRPSFRYKKFCF